MPNIHPDDIRSDEELREELIHLFAQIATYNPDIFREGRVVFMGNAAGEVTSFLSTNQMLMLADAVREYADKFGIDGGTLHRGPQD